MLTHLGVELHDQQLDVGPRRDHALGRVGQQAVDHRERVGRRGRLGQAPVRVHEQPQAVEVDALAVEQRRVRDVDGGAVADVEPRPGRTRGRQNMRETSVGPHWPRHFTCGAMWKKCRRYE